MFSCARPHSLTLALSLSLSLSLSRSRDVCVWLGGGMGEVATHVCELLRHTEGACRPTYFCWCKFLLGSYGGYGVDKDYFCDSQLHTLTLVPNIYTAPSLSLSFSLSLSLSRSLCIALSLSFYISLSFIVSLFSLPLARCRSRSLTHTRTHKHTRTRTHTHTHIHTQEQSTGGNMQHEEFVILDDD